MSARGLPRAQSAFRGNPARVEGVLRGGDSYRASHRAASFGVLRWRGVPGAVAGAVLPRLAHISRAACRIAARAMLECFVTGLLAWRRGQPGQVGNEAATAVFRQCRGSGSSPSSFSAIVSPRSAAFPRWRVRSSAESLPSCRSHAVGRCRRRLASREACVASREPASTQQQSGP